MDGPVDQERLDFARGFMCASNPGPAPPKPPTAEAYPAERITLAWLAGHAAGMERRRKRRQPPAGNQRALVYWWVAETAWAEVAAGVGTPGLIDFCLACAQMAEVELARSLAQGPENIEIELLTLAAKWRPEGV